MQFPNPLTYDGLVDTGIFQKNHILGGENAPFDGLMYETFGAEVDYVREIAQKYPNRIATVLDCNGGTYLGRGYSHVDRIGYLVATADLPEFESLEIVAPEIDEETQDEVEFLFGVAAQHGKDSEADHEVGDLQVFLRAIYGLLSEERRKELFNTDGMMDALCSCVGKELMEIADDLKDHKDFSAEGLIVAAKKHAEESDEPEHEVGDLQSFTLRAFVALTNEERSQFYRVDGVLETIATAVGVKVSDIAGKLPEKRR